MKEFIKNKYEKIFFIILIFLSFTEIIIYIITLFFPDLCYGCTYIGRFHQYLNEKYKLAYLSWISYIIICFYLIYKAIFIKNKLLKYSVIILLFIIIYLPTLPLINLITLLLSVLYINPPFINNYHNIFPESVNIEKKADIIINEYKEFSKNTVPECIRKTNPGFRIENGSDQNNCWRALYLKKIGKIDNQMAKYFPETIQLISDTKIHNAFFSILDPNVEISPHVGYYKGYLRYHLGIIIPNNENNTLDKAYIVCGNEKYVWKEKEGVMFDDMYLHYVNNPTNQRRVVLYLDVKRISNSYVINKINDMGIYLIENSIVFNTFLKNQHKQNNVAE